MPSGALALEVYRWNDEVGKTIDTYGYGTTGSAAKLQTASICIIYAYTERDRERAPVHNTPKKHRQRLIPTAVFILVAVG